MILFAVLFFFVVSLCPSLFSSLLLCCLFLFSFLLLWFPLVFFLSFLICFGFFPSSSAFHSSYVFVFFSACCLSFLLVSTCLLTARLRVSTIMFFVAIIVVVLVPVLPLVALAVHAFVFFCLVLMLLLFRATGYWL